MTDAHSITTALGGHWHGGKLAALAEAEATLIDSHDTVDACAATGGRATEFVSR